VKKAIIVSIVDVSQKNGQGVYALKTIEAFCKSKELVIHLILPKPSDPDMVDFIGTLAEVTFLPRKKENRKIGWHLLIQVKLFIALIRLGRVDAVIYSVKPTMIAPFLFSTIYNCPLYVLVEGLATKTLGTLTQGLGLGLGRFVLNANIKKAKKVFPAYLSAKRWVDSLREDDSILISCGVDSDKFYEKEKNTTSVLTVGYVGSFRRVHMLRELIMSTVNLGINVKLVGDGEMKSELKDLVNQLGVAEHVEFLGRKRQDELSSFFSNCDVMWAACDPSHWGVPIKCFEYLACNKKVIYIDKEDLTFIEENDFGFCLRGGEVEFIREFFVWLESFYSMGKLHDNENSRAYISRNNTWESFNRKVLSEVLMDFSD
jgi:glycosyltransferase involved in cell wall biosynthesis